MSVVWYLSLCVGCECSTAAAGKRRKRAPSAGKLGGEPPGCEHVPFHRFEYVVHGAPVSAFNEVFMAAINRRSSRLEGCAFVSTFLVLFRR